MFNFWKKPIKPDHKFETKIQVTWPEGTEHYSDGPVWDCSWKDTSKLSSTERLLVESWKNHIQINLKNSSVQEKRKFKNLVIEKLSKPYLNTIVLDIVLELVNKEM